MQAWLQDFAWTSQDVAVRQKALIKRFPVMGKRLQRQPMFCMETALKMVLWSYCGYTITPADVPGVFKPTAGVETDPENPLSQAETEQLSCDLKQLDEAPVGRAEAVKEAVVSKVYSMQSWMDAQIWISEHSIEQTH
jgi:hypothetical protein